MTMTRPLLAALLSLAALGCTAPLARQQADLCAGDAPAPCAPGAATPGALCARGDAGPLDGVCAADGQCLPPCRARLDCASLTPGAGPCEAVACDAVSGACSYQTVDGVGCPGAP